MGVIRMTDEEIEVIVKPIFTKMFKANFSACEYGIECYKKGMEYQGIKELAIENDNLIKRITYFEKQIEKMKCCANCNTWLRNEDIKHCKNCPNLEGVKILRGQQNDRRTD